MNNVFSNNFKELRKSHELTQEQIAEMLGVTSQAISKWECGASYPDIEILPVIANIFKVSLDHLLGVDIARQDNVIADIIEESKKLCDDDKYMESVSLLRNALIQYPANCDIMYRLAWSLRGTISEHPEHEKEAINIYHRILNISKNSELICMVTRDLSYCYNTLDDIETAKAYINMLPGFEVCREYHLGISNVFEGKALAEVLNKNIRLYATAIKECLEYYTDDKILKEHEKSPYTTQKAIKHLEFIDEILG